MAVLNSWQKITRVIDGKPFGDGIDGDYSSSTIPTMIYRSCSGSSGSTTLTLGSSGFSNGDLILIHQTRGTGVGQWEINKVVSGGGTTSLTLQTALQYTYTDSGASQAQAVKIFRYNNVTCPSGTWTVPSWNGDTGGILTLAARGTLTVSGTITAYASGYVGGTSWIGNGQRYSGEGTAGTAVAQTNANGNSGGGANIINQWATGGGGGHVSAGGNGNQTSPSVRGLGGNNYFGTNDLTNMIFGGAGGGSGKDTGSSTSNGANGGGIIAFFAKSITEITGTITTTGGSSSNADTSGGAGAGGSVLIVCKDAVLGTNKITSLAGTPGTGTMQGGTASIGRIALHYSGTYSGSTNPTLYANQDTTLVESAGGIFFHNFL